MKLIVILTIFLAFSTSVEAQKKGWLLNVPKKTVVVLKIPKSSFGFTKRSVWSGRTTYSVQIDQDEEGNVLVENEKNWKQLDWNLMSDFFVEKVKKRKKKGIRTTEVLLKNNLINIKLIFLSSVTDVGKTFDELTFKGYLNEYERSDYYKNEVVDWFLPRVFKGRLAGISDDFKLRLLKATNYETGNFGGENYKGSYYFVIKDAPKTVFNSIKLNQSQRVSYVFNKMLLNSIKGIHEEIKEVDGIDGVKIEYLIPHKNFVTGLDFGTDKLIIYAKSEYIRAFSEFDITGQDFLDKSVVIVNNNRIKVNLTL